MSLKIRKLVNTMLMQCKITMWKNPNILGVAKRISYVSSLLHFITFLFLEHGLTLNLRDRLTILV